MTDGNILDRIIGATAYDPQGDKIGKIDQVYLDDETGKPVWATINTGLFGSSQSFAPLLRSHMKGDDVVLGVDKSVVKDAPRVADNGHLDDEETRRLYQYYRPHLQAGDGRSDRMAGVGGRHDRDGDGKDDRAQRVFGDHDRDNDGVDDRRERGYDDRNRADRVMGRDGDYRDDRGTQYAGEGTGALGGAAAGAAAGGMTGGRRDHDRDNDGKDDRVQRVLGDHDRDNDGLDDRRERRVGDGMGDNRIEHDRDRFGDRRDANYREDGESFGGLSERDYYDDRYEGMDRDRDRDMDRRDDRDRDRERELQGGQSGQGSQGMQQEGRQRRLRRHAPMREVHEVKDAQGNVVERTITEHLPDDNNRR